jgi:hypothetical protein
VDVERDPNRTVHAKYDGMEIVRYDRQGHWYLEPTLPLHPRQRVSINYAIQAALWGTANANGVIFLGLPGGLMFDAKVKQA